jgi:hypothetical protein
MSGFKQVHSENFDIQIAVVREYQQLAQTGFSRFPGVRLLPLC